MSDLNVSAAVPFREFRPNPQATGESLRINEIFVSVQGESTRVGLPTVFIRLTGCPLRCGYCDTAHAFHTGTTRPLDGILAEIAGLQCPTVCVTGGEPLAQPGCLNLLQRLCDAGYSVSLETSGALDIAAVDSRVSRIVDIKTPGSGEEARNFWPNLEQLRAGDELKFVLCDEDDYLWAARLVTEQQLAQRCPVLFSPCWESLPPATLAEWVVRDRLPVRFQLQLHKVLWGEERGR